MIIVICYQEDKNTGKPTVSARIVMLLVPGVKTTGLWKTKLFSMLLPCPNPELEYQQMVSFTLLV